MAPGSPGRAPGVAPSRRVPLWLAWPLAVLAVSVTAYFVAFELPGERQQAIEDRLSKLEAAVDANASAVDLWLADGLDEVTEMASYPTLRAMAAGQAPARASEHLGSLLDTIVHVHDYRSVFAVDVSGRVLASSSHLRSLEPPCLDLVKAVATSGMPRAELHAHSGGEPVVAFAAPVAVGVGGGTAAVVVLTADPRAWLYPQLEHPRALTRTGEALLVERQGDEAVFISPLRHSSAAPLTFRRPLDMPGFLATQALEGRQVAGQFTDYRGHAVLGATRHLRSARWGLVVKVDLDEALEGYRQAARQRAGTLLAGLLALAALAFATWRSALATDRAAHILALQESEERYRFLFNNMLEGYAHCRVVYGDGVAVDFLFLDVNEAFERLTGLKDVVGKKVSAVIPGVHETNPELLQIYGRVAETGIPERFETYLPPLDMWFSISVYSPSREHFVAVFDVITEHKRAEEALRESEEKFRYVFENTPLGKSITLANGQLQVNRAFAEMLGFSLEELTQLRWQDVTHPEDVEPTQRTLDPLYSGAIDSARFVKRYLRKDGAVVWGEVITSVRRDEAGRVVYFMTSVNDITERKRVEEALAESERGLAARNQILQVFLTVPDEELYTEVLRVLLDVMESPYGVFGYIDEKGSLVVPTMTRHVWDKCQVPEKNIVFPRETWGCSSWPTAIREKRIICSNEPSTSTPNGHIAIRRHISLPLIHRGEAVGLLQVANKMTDYSPQDIALLEGIGNQVAPVLDARLKREQQERERMRAEEALRESEERARRQAEEVQTLMDTLPVAVWVAHDPECRVVTGNQAANRFFESGPDENVSPGPAHGGERDTTRRFFRDGHELQPEELPMQEAVATGKEVLDFELDVVRPSGTTMTIIGNAAPLFNPNGEVRGCIGAYLDITERKRAAEALRESEEEARRRAEELQTLMDLLPTAVWVAHDPECRVITGNQAANRFYEAEEDENVSAGPAQGGEQDSTRRFFLDGKELKPEELPMQVAVATGREVLGSELTVLRPSGHVMTMVGSATPLFDAGGSVRGCIGAFVDITDRKRAENALRQAHEGLERRVDERTRELRVANQELEAFSYSVSHDLRAPLRAIDGFSRMLQEDYTAALDAEGHRLLGVVRDQTQRMGCLIDDLLAFSRAGRQELSRARVDMNALVEIALHDLTGETERARLDIVVESLPPAWCDPALLRQVWTNLLSNALKFSAPRPRSRVQVHGALEDGRAVYRISDNGVGFDMAYADKLFGVFQRLHSGREFPGTGVGLALVKRIVTRHGGDVRGEGTPGEGATFTFWLPRGGEVA